MIHAKISKLNRHIGEHFFDRAMAEISGATEEGLEMYELDVNQIEEEAKFDLIDALEVMGYSVDYDPAGERLEISIE